MKNTSKWLPLLCFFLIAAVCLSGCGNAGDGGNSAASSDTSSANAEIIDNGDGSWSCDLFAMDTVMQLKAFGGKEAQRALAKASDEITKLDRELNVANENSPVSALNRRQADIVTGDTAEVLEQSLRMAELTGGTFDPTIYPIVRAWGFTTQKYRVPDASEITELLNHVDYGSVSASKDNSGLHILFGDEQMEIDTGGIGKGYASEKVYDIMKEEGVTSAVVSLGGNVMTLGKKTDGSSWKVAIEDPFNSGGTEYAGVIQLTDKYAITSGGYQRYFEEGGKTYIHIMDPATGYPVENDLSSVTIISDSGTEGDALSTALYVMGLDRAMEFWKTTELEFDMILITQDKEIYITENIAGDFTTDSPDYGKPHTVSR